ncbi:RNA polymerase subunit sigma-24 [Candidatus Roizmanbacteria bacterium CG_4_10_14_0_8_um_filter_39_9]|uniref:RNA polymerase subunit sigma-24 n=1 Tax=Candidatus Roizmanbacteria bacterium CG_4_10_14_0_8_um_filter_39_9 TaxID=1974829 RepID=A0A2M7QD88_9BACT|nr:MAG: RNA polymerase subunit sigma-24 [Candidatus Roizmanbacteria bacterium CG_4_10_14_0_8_um_filter_39_9]
MLNWLSSDIFLIRRLKHGDSDAFGKLYLKYLDSIYRYIYFRVGQKQELAEDLSETVFTKAWENITKFKEHRGTLKAWLYMIAKNVVVDHYRKAKPTIALDENITGVNSVIETEIEKNEDIRQLMSCLNQLTTEQKQVITMKYIEDMSNQEIAQILNKQEDAVRALQHRALQKLRELLK